MSYDVHWRVPFVALNGDRYRVDVLDEDWGDEIITLIGSDNPFETTESTSDNIFTPIRSCTGALRIADNGFDADGNEFDYMDMLPNDIFDFQVQLWKEGEVPILRWIGYIKPDTLTSRMYDKVSIREFRLTCPLGCMYSIDFSFSNNKSNMGSVQTIGQILYNALSSLNVEWQKVYQQRNIAPADDLTAKISLMNFIGNDIAPTHSAIQPDGDPDIFTATWTDRSQSWGNVVEKICEFFGWTLYSRGLNLYIIAHENVSTCLKFDFDTLLNDDISYLPQENDEIIYTDELTYASKNHTESRMVGRKEIIVKSSANEYEAVINPDFSQLELEVFSNPSGGSVNKWDSQHWYTAYKMKQNMYPQEELIKIQFIGNYQIYENRTIQTSTLFAEFIVTRYDAFLSTDFPTKDSYSFRDGICHYKGGQTGALLYFAKTMYDVCIPVGSVVSINASATLNYYGDDSTGNLEGRTVRCALRIGNKYYYNGGWNDSWGSFDLPLNNNGKLTYEQNELDVVGNIIQGVLVNNHNGSNGYCIPIADSGLCGRMELMIYANPGEPTTKELNCVLNTLTVSIYNEDSRLLPLNKPSHEYRQIASNKFREDMEVNLAMASGNRNLYGFGQLFRENMELLVTLPYIVGGDMQPEQNLLGRLSRIYGSTIYRSTIEVMDDEIAELPNTIFTQNEYSAKTYRLQSCSHNWRQGTMKLTIIEE